jgi:hypothetical protein
MVNKEIPLVGAYSIVGDSVVFSTPPNEGDLVELTRDTQLDRETNFKSYDNSFRPETINFDLDKIWLVLQESNLVDAKILARLKQEIEWRRTHDFNYDELAQVREKQLFDALKGYTDTLNAATNPGVFQGVIAGVVFAQDGKSIQSHLEEILHDLAVSRENINKKADKSYVDEQLGLKADQQTTYNKTEVDAALGQKANQATTYTKSEVDSVVAPLTGGHKAYTTLALAQAAQGTLPVNSIVEVTNDPTDSNNGTYQWNGTTLTKSAYDPLTQAKADATTKANAAEANSKSLTKVATDIFDASAHSNNYSMTFLEAISSVPADLRKQGLTVRYNNADERTFVNNNVANWSVQRLWIRQINPEAEGKVNHFDERMLYAGFTVGNLGVTSVEDPRNKVAIIPIHRTYTDGVLNKLNLSAAPVNLKNISFGFLNANGETINGTVVGGYTAIQNQTIHADAKYLLINLESYNSSTQTISNEGNFEVAKKYLTYFPDNSNPVVLRKKIQDGSNAIKYGNSQSLIIDKSLDGERLVSPYFKETTKSENGMHIAHFVKKVEFQKGKMDLLKPDGSYRKFSITRIGKSSTGGVYIQVTFENEIGNIVSPDLGTVLQFQPNAGGLVEIEWVSYRIADYFKLKVTIDPEHLSTGSLINFTFENGEIHPMVIANSAKIQGVNKGIQFSQFQQVGVAKTNSNQAQPNPEPLVVTPSMQNGVVSQDVKGTADKPYQQMAMIASKTARFAGKANIYVDAKSNYPNNPKVSMLRAPSAVDYNLAVAPIANQTTDVMGKTLSSQYIHPDICYCPQPVGGHKYWMINSVWPNANEQFEDPELFVSNDGVEWTRVRGFTEANSGGLPFKLPEIYWNSDHKNGFMPIPISGSFEFAKDTVTEVSNVTSTYLAHDPAISYHDGYVNFYVLYNFGLGTTTRDHKYIVCYRTNDGINWEIVREDGTTMPYNSTNALLIFTKTNGVRNHIKYFYGANGVGSSRAFAPQVVKVSDTEWYMYTATNLNTTPSTGYTMSLVRYRGNNPYVFDWNNPEKLSRTNNFGGTLWHFGMHYNSGKFYCVFNGYLAVSTDGINFTVGAYRFFWQGMSSDLYKPTLVVGHDGKVKMAYSLHVHTAVPHPYKPQIPYNVVNPERLYHYVKLAVTLTTEFTSLADLENRSNNPVEDAYADVIIASISQATKSVKYNLVPCVRSLTEVTEALDVTYDDEIYVVVHLNTRNGGSLEFKGVAATLPSSAVH